MGPDPFNMPGAGAAGSAQSLNDFVAQAAPYAQVWHGPIVGPSVPTLPPIASTSQSSSNISKFSHFLSNVGSEIGHLAEGAASWVATQATHFGEGLINVPKAAYNFGVGAIEMHNQTQQVNQLTAQQQTLAEQWKAGIISASAYTSAVKNINNQLNDLSKQMSATQSRLSTARSESASALGSLATVAAAILTDGVGSSLADGAAAKFLTSVNANAMLKGAEESLTKVASSPELFAKLSPAAKQALQMSTAEVMANAGRASAGQIARAAVTNLAIKYPFYYNYISSTGSQLYQELDNKKYGDATRTAAFNAALLLSGGPIGYALKKLGSGAKGVVGAVFSRTPFLDELSKGIGNGDPAGLFNAVMKLPPSERADVVKQLSAVESTNLGAVGGKDTAAAAARVLNGMENYEGLSMRQFSHDEALSNMVNFAKAQRMASEEADKLGIPAVTVGRWDVRDKQLISESLAKASTTEDRKTVWETLKQTYPNSAWANSENLDRQIKNLIDKHGDPSELNAAIQRIKATERVDGLPTSLTKALAKMGYEVIRPANLEAPFAEGSGKVTSKFASENNNLFLKAVQPLPVLGSVGKLLTGMGLSPYASQQRVYQLFNDNLVKNLEGSGVVRKIMGEDLHDTTDTMIKKLSQYANNPTRGKIVSHIPITDLRMLTAKDIQIALDVSHSDASEIQKAISRAFLQVPMSVRALGDRAVDALYHLGPTGALQRRYLRLQGAARFSWNPFFQYLRLIPKTEVLSEFEGGGFIKSVFAGRLGEISNIRKSLVGEGFLEKNGFRGIEGGEGVDFVGAMGKNLNKKLLPMQERSIAGLVDAQARRMGMSWQDYIKTYPDHVRDIIQMIAEYDRRGDFINSPLMRTLNIAFFPLRFDVKVAQIMARSLSRTSLMTQVATVNGVLRAHDWLNSPEGQAWYSQNSEVIGLMEYVSPFAKMNEIFQSLLPGHDHSLGNFGELGGLPFGWIPQLLDAEGLTQFNQPGVDTKTGAVYKQYIPITARGQLATAIQDFVGSLFSYPGATVGLPSKNKITLGIGEGLTGANKTDFNSITPQVSGQQKQYSDLIQQLSGTNPGKIQPVAQPGLQNGVSVPSTAGPLPPTKNELKSSKYGSSRKGGRLKKADFAPQLLPGQSNFGQL